MKVVLVCAGNICRSPMAAALFAHHARAHPALAGVEVRSAGVIAFPGTAAETAAVDVMQARFCLDISGHSARLFDHRTEADLILAVDRWVASRVKALKPKGEVALLGDFAGSGDEVDDPFGGDEEAYAAAATHIDQLVRAAVAKLAARTAKAPRGNSS